LRLAEARQLMQDAGIEQEENQDVEIKSI